MPLSKHGQNWLLLRGLSRESAHWGNFIAQMQYAFSPAQIFTIDLPGTGVYFIDKSPASVPEITRIVHQHALELGLLIQPLNILALSMGGMIAWEWMLTFPKEINACVLVNTSIASISPFYQRLRWQSLVQFAKILLESDLEQRETKILQLVSNRSDLHKSTALEWANIQRQRPVNVLNSIRQIKAAANFKPAVNKPKQQILLLNSLGDRLVAPTCSTAIHNKWQIKLISHPWAGHDLSLDDGIWLTNTIKSWIDNSDTTII